MNIFSCYCTDSSKLFVSQDPIMRWVSFVLILLKSALIHDCWLFHNLRLVMKINTRLILMLKKTGVLQTFRKLFKTVLSYIWLLIWVLANLVNEAHNWDIIEFLKLSCDIFGIIESTDVRTFIHLGQIVSSKTTYLWSHSRLPSWIPSVPSGRLHNRSIFYR